MTEKLSQSPEQKDNKSLEELEDAGVERRAELERQHEQSAEKSQEGDVERARKALEKVTVEEEPKQEKSPAEKRKDTPLPRKTREKVSFARNMDEARSHMSTPSRAFSKVIHARAVEKTSEAVGSTIARPNAILAGSATAFLATLVIYLIARYNGYPLSGFETIGAFAFGWVLGIMFDYLRVMVTGKR